MATTETQYDKLFNLLMQYSERYYVETEKVYSKFGREWKACPCRFEIDTYFLFKLSEHMQRLGYNQDASQKTCTDFEERIIQYSSGKFPVADDLQNIVRRRIVDYCEGDASISLLRNIDADNVAEQVEIESLVVIGDFFEKSEIKTSMVLTEIRIAGEFQCCLKHHFEEVSDIRSLSVQEMNKLIDDGRKEAKQILPNLLDEIRMLAATKAVVENQLRKGFGKQKKWWQLWK